MTVTEVAMTTFLEKQFQGIILTSFYKFSA